MPYSKIPAGAEAPDGIHKNHDAANRGAAMYVRGAGSNGAGRGQRTTGGYKALRTEFLSPSRPQIKGETPSDCLGRASGGEPSDVAAYK